MREGWYPRWRIRHTAFSIIATLIIILIRIAGKNSTGSELAPSPAELIVLVISVSFFGVPHGATDHLVGVHLFKPKFPKTWLLVFVVVYLAMMGIVVLCWWIAPSTSLALFLLMSVVHWGLGDAEEELTPSFLYPAEVCLRGALPILLPCVAYQDYVVKIFSWLVGSKASEGEAVRRIMAALSWLSPPLLAAFLVCVVWHVIGALSASAPLQTNRRGGEKEVQGRRVRQGLTACEVVLLGGLCVTCTPLTSFMVYFCLWHSFRHIMVVSATSFDDQRALPALSTFFMHASPFTLATLGIAAWSWDGITGSVSVPPSLEGGEGQSSLAAMAQIVFIGLSAVTVPHMIITEVSQVRQRAAGGPTSGKSGGTPVEMTVGL